MDRKPDKTVEPAPEEIRCEMAETRAGLTDKLEMLEGRVNEKIENVQHRVEATVDKAKDTVHDTVEMVKASVEKAKDNLHETVQKVKSTFDLRQQVFEHPWTMVGGAVALGFLVGHRMGSFDASRTSFHNLRSPTGAIPGNGGASELVGGHDFAPPQQTSGHTDRLVQKASSELHQQIDRLENAAITAAGNFVERLIRQAIPV
jgi:ElaB/YqjD/DUF883 family membrane-anchored ribosome-binding protein